MDLKKFTALGDDKIVVSYMQDGDLKEMETNFLFMALGRTPSTGSLNLKNAEVELLPSGHIRTDQFQRTSCRSIYAAGDCA